MVKVRIDFLGISGINCSFIFDQNDIENPVLSANKVQDVFDSFLKKTTSLPVGCARVVADYRISSPNTTKISFKISINDRYIIFVPVGTIYANGSKNIESNCRVSMGMDHIFAEDMWGICMRRCRHEV